MSQVSASQWIESKILVEIQDAVFEAIQYGHLGYVGCLRVYQICNLHKVPKAMVSPTTLTFSPLGCTLG